MVVKEDAQGTRHKFTKKLVIIGIVLVLIVVAVVLSLWLSQRNTVKIKITDEDRIIAEKAMNGSLTNDDLDKIAQEGIDQYDELNASTTAPTASVVPAGFKAGSWTENIQTKDGMVKVDYKITGSAGKSIVTRWETDSAGYTTLYSRNIANVPIRLTYTAIDTDANGTILNTLQIDEILAPGEEDNHNIGMPEETNLKISASAK